MSDDDYMVEFVTVGASVKATAFDPVTLKEASVIAPAKTKRGELAKLAVRKLQYILAKSSDSQ